ncbi:hypothetical protein B0J11DRAFT_602911 [Dendryphion nanum]|uniref:Uncharacterized protein n=1 Tax=Dendryphion nanum TaxID=256645 RepID=A0A9P9IS99_9PLEO|nr:hypothetical protein B0J11DRAFT_602911 [Dendryphion nanum]
MAPYLKETLQTREFDLNGPSPAFKALWVTPSNYAFTILLLLGGDVVSRALAQLAGGFVTPVAFSFGWVSYAVSAINSAIGENKLMPGADTPCTVINAANGQSRSNGSWVLGRLMRDFEYWMGKPVKDKVLELKNSKWEYDKAQAKSKGEDVKKIEFPSHAGLVLSFWKFDENKKQQFQRPGRDVLFWSGIIVAFLQLGISAIPFGLYGNWAVFLVTASAVVLCLLTGCHTQWRREKWACRQIEGRKRTYILTRGNGAQHAIIVECDGCGLNLEDLCTGFDNLDSPSISKTTRLSMVVLGSLWIILLITSSSSALTEQSWYLIAVGGIGMLQNMFVAGWSRHPEALGIPLKFTTVIGSPKVITALIEAEKGFPTVGRALVGTFFPGGLFPNEEKELEAIEDEEKGRRRKIKERDNKNLTEVKSGTL